MIAKKCVKLVFSIPTCMCVIKIDDGRIQTLASEVGFLPTVLHHYHSLLIAFITWANGCHLSFLCFEAPTTRHSILEIDFLNGPIPAYFSLYFRLFKTSQFKFKLIKAYMVYLGFEPGAAGWKAQTNPLSYGGIPEIDFRY